MKHIFLNIRLFIFIGSISLLTSSCEDIMSTDTNRYLLADENQINSANDTVYSVVGILQKVQQLADKYVLLGELRGDLLDVSDKADLSLRELSEFSGNLANSEYANPKDYYAVINNCNYFIKHANVDLKTPKNTTYQPFAREVAAVKTIRAWTYLQLVLNYGKAYYTDEPFNDIKQTLTELPEYNQIQMFDTLISQITALRPNENYNLTFPGFAGSARYLFINPLFLLGDLHLWRASLNHSISDYEYAATYYAYLIKKGPLPYTIPEEMRVYWQEDTYNIWTDSWSLNITSPGNREIISSITMADNASVGTATVLPSLAYERILIPSKYLDNLFATQQYCFVTSSTATPKYSLGDLRGRASYGSKLINDEQNYTVGNLEKYIKKYIFKNIVLARASTLYLRYAEAVNRAGKPNLAFAVLKYGLNSTTLSATPDASKPNVRYVPASEIADNKEYVNLFINEIALFKSNIGIHSRGSGNSSYNANFIIPDASKLATRNDTINFVENAICDELALENAFEGNRFHDLMRMSNNRSKPSFIAEKVAEKHPNDKQRYIDLLSDSKNWYLPMKK